MELWLLSAGAIVLIGITLWIVWPVRASDTVGTPAVREKEAGETSMTETPRPGSGLPPQGDTFEDQYTSATADLSAGGFASALEAMQEGAPGTTPPPGTHAGGPATPEVPLTPGAPSFGSPASPTFGSSPPPWTPPPFDEHTGPEPRKIGLGAAILLALLGGIGGAWLYARWQRERNKPINRLRRSARELGSGAREFGSRLGERMPEVDDLPAAAAPMSGAAAALLLAGLLASRVARRDDDDPAERVREAVDEATDRGRKAARRGRDAAEAGGREALKRGRDAAEAGGREATKRGRDAAKHGRSAAAHAGGEAGKRGHAAADSELLQEATELAGKAARRGRSALEHGGREAFKRGRDAALSGLIREALERGLEAAAQGREAAAHRGKDVAAQGRTAAARGRETAKRSAKEARAHLEDADALAPSGKPAKMGIGVGSAAAMAAGAYLVWRLTHRQPPPDQKPWYAGVEN